MMAIANDNVRTRGGVSYKMGSQGPSIFDDRVWCLQKRSVAIGWRSQRSRIGLNMDGQDIQDDSYDHLLGRNMGFDSSP